jgi:hypothetical protein
MRAVQRLCCTLQVAQWQCRLIKEFQATKQHDVSNDQPQPTQERRLKNAETQQQFVSAVLQEDRAKNGMRKRERQVQNDSQDTGMKDAALTLLGMQAGAQEDAGHAATTNPAKTSTNRLATTRASHAETTAGALHNGVPDTITRISIVKVSKQQAQPGTRTASPADQDRGQGGAGALSHRDVDMASCQEPVEQSGAPADEPEQADRQAKKRKKDKKRKKRLREEQSAAPAGEAPAELQSPGRPKMRKDAGPSPPELAQHVAADPAPGNEGAGDDDNMHADADQPADSPAGGEPSGPAAASAAEATSSKLHKHRLQRKVEMDAATSGKDGKKRAVAPAPAHRDGCAPGPLIFVAMESTFTASPRMASDRIDVYAWVVTICASSKIYPAGTA